MNRSSRLLLLVLVCAAVLGASYPVIRTLHGNRTFTASTNTFYLSIPAEEPNAAPRAFDTRTYEDFPVFKAEQGMTLTLTVHSERAGSIHIHGYQTQFELVPHADVAVRFEATHAGLFPVHLHGADNAMEHMATFEIQPR